MPRGKRIESPLELAKREPYKSIIQIVGRIGQKDKRARTQAGIVRALTRNFHKGDWGWLENEVRRLRPRIKEIERVDSGYPLPTARKPSTISQRVYGYLKTLVENGVLTKTREEGVGNMYGLSNTFAIWTRIASQIDRLQTSTPEQMDLFSPMNVTLYSGCPYKLDPKSQAQVLDGASMMMFISQHIWGIHWRAVERVLEGLTDYVFKSSLPIHLKDLIFNVLSDARLAILDRYVRSLDYGSFHPTTRTKLPQGTLPEEEDWKEIDKELRWERTFRVLTGGRAYPLFPCYRPKTADYPHRLPDGFLDDFSEEEVRIAWQFRRFLGDLREWTVRPFEIIDGELGQEQADLTNEVLDNFYGFFKEHGVKRRALDELRDLYHLIGEDFDPHIVVGPQLANTTMATPLFVKLVKAMREF